MTKEQRKRRPMTALLEQTFKKLSALPPDQQDAVAQYIDQHCDEFLEHIARQKRIADGTYTSDDFNEETKKGLAESEEEIRSGKLKSYDSFADARRDLGI